MSLHSKAVDVNESNHLMRICWLAVCTNFSKGLLHSSLSQLWFFNVHSFSLLVSWPFWIINYQSVLFSVRPQITILYLMLFDTRAVMLFSSVSPSLSCCTPLSDPTDFQPTLYRCIAAWPLSILQVLVITPTKPTGETLLLSNQRFQYRRQNGEERTYIRG